MLNLEGESRHFLFATAIRDRHFLSSQKFCGAGCVDSGIAAADHHYSRAGWERSAHFISLNVTHRVDDLGRAFTAEIQGMALPETYAEKDGIELILDLL